MNETTLSCCESDFKVYLSAAARQRIPSRISRSRRGAYPRTTPTSGLDKESERLVFEGLNNLFKGRTNFVVAHHLNTISHAD